MNLGTFAFFVIQFKWVIENNNKYNVVLLLLYLLAIAFLIPYSIFMGNNLGLVFRFSFILLFLMLGFFIKPNEKYLSVFLFFNIFQALFLIGFHLILNYFFTIDTYNIVRFWFKEHGFGDVYTYNGYLYNIQLLGNALLPVSFFICLVIFKGFKRFLMASISLLGVLVAGNFAFFLGVFIFFVLFIFIKVKVEFINWILSFAFLFCISLAMFNPVLNYIETTLDKKSEESNPVRIDQAQVLLDDLKESNFTFLFGKGLGNTVDRKTKWRNYQDNVYFELQSLYFLNQLGVLPFLIFVSFNILLIIIFFSNPLVKATYISYLFYSSFNPYFLDTSHIIVVVVLISLNRYLKINKGISQNAINK